MMLHGQEAEYAAQDKAEVVPLRDLRGKGIDYLALGHVHGYKKETLDSRGEYCYPGCLECRGFDEYGDAWLCSFRCGFGRENRGE